jgi:hypothetical protein
LIVSWFFSCCLLFFAWGGLGLQFSFLCFTYSWDYSMNQHAVLVCWDGVWLTFWLGWPWILILLNTASWIAQILYRQYPPLQSYFCILRAFKTKTILVINYIYLLFFFFLA